MGVKHHHAAGFGEDMARFDSAWSDAGHSDRDIPSPGNTAPKRPPRGVVAAGLFCLLTGSAFAAEPSQNDLADEVRKLRDEVAKLRAEQDQQRQQQQQAADDRADKAMVERTMKEVLADAEKRGGLLSGSKDKWYEKLGVRGYTQLRYHPLVSGGSGEPDLSVPNDRTVDADSQTFNIRRGRFVLSGDVTDHLALYAQLDFAGSVGSGLDFAVQARDLYADIAIDDAKEHRFRVGQSKVPFGWVNLQSSQNRAPFERPDALNSAVEGERDIGVYYMWASSEARKRFKELVSSGLKGSGDYGVIAVGAYSGNGLNRSDNNGEPHWVARASYPFKLDNGQFIEVGVQGYYGRFLSQTGPVDLGGGSFTPTVHERGVLDQRVGATFVYYPQPFGIEAEYMIGRGPQLDTADQEIDDQFLHGGYVQLNYRIEDASTGLWFPFVRYQYYEGGRKFTRNAPGEIVQEIDLGIEWSPRPELELSAMYTRSLDRTNTSSGPYGQATGDRFGMQLQFNY